MAEQPTIHNLAVLLATLDTKMDRILEYIPKIEDHETEIAIMQSQELDTRVNKLEQSHWKMMGMGSLFTTIVAFISYYIGRH